MLPNEDYERYFPTFNEFAREVHRAGTIPMDALWMFYDDYVRSIVETLRDDPACPYTPEQLTVTIPHSVIRDQLGTAWFERNVVKVDAAGKRDHQLTRLLRRYRAISLGRSLYELQGFDWFDGLVKKLRKDTFSGVAFELQVLSLLRHLPAASFPKAEEGMKGRDFDASVYFMGEHIPIEAKAKDDGTAWSPRTVVDTLKRAATQLPDGEPGVVFLRVPPTWVTPGRGEEYAEALHEGTRQSRRVEAVVSIVDKPHLTSASTGNVTSVYDVFRRSEPVSDAPWAMVLLLKQLLELDAFAMGPQAPF